MCCGWACSRQGKKLAMVAAQHDRFIMQGLSFCFCNTLLEG